MTTLDSFLASLPKDVHLLTGHQQTPNTISLSYTEEDFLKILHHPITDKFLFRFLEEKNSSDLLIHLFFTHSNSNIQVSISVKNRTTKLNQQLIELFPSAAFYLDGIE